MNPIELTSGQALHLWHQVALDLVRDGKRDLTQRQVAILLEVYLKPPPHTIRDLASKLQVTKPVITRALDTMGQMGLLSRRRDDADRRNVLVQRTVEGSNYVEQLGELVSSTAGKL
ncbi:MAG: MarR family winged helix-turn-helix transcriptional regulator [Rhizobiaceae bacterium]|nr:MarR family winged helix-turn-helix transcriptional regulator [Rhizobiaceae bacterium]